MAISKEGQTGLSSRVHGSGVFVVGSETCISCASESPISYMYANMNFPCGYRLTL